MTELLITYYGDDLTGSTDSMEALVLGGVPTVLFLEPPDKSQLERFPGVRAVGLAGVSRTMTPGEMDQQLPSDFARLKELNAPLLHYKVCSTFDSSPEIGSIGRAIELGIQIMDNPPVFVAVGAPKLRRYVVFGNHFATSGEVTYRLDRHPTMRVHPITPMNESDLRLHLGKQTWRPIDLIDIRGLAAPQEAIKARLRQIAEQGVDIVILDTLDDAHLLKVGEMLWDQGSQKPAFTVGSSGVEFALTAYWQASGIIEPPRPLLSPGAVDQIVAISGSAAPMTAAQIERALEIGFRGIRLNSAALIDAQTAGNERERAISVALESLEDGKSVILYTALGPDDPSIPATRQRMESLGIPPQNVSRLLGAQQGAILKDVLLLSGLGRVAVAGGDTSGNVLKQLGMYVLEMLVPLGTATPLCRARSHRPELDGLEIALKGGQLGELDFFEYARQGIQMDKG
ncbi:MAG: four-carbon acid sugar kinase family protein [Anaerolineales bacterium]|nr:four-carbon acid sugar kinase family protein [Anaerolineales bacterium]